MVKKIVVSLKLSSAKMFWIFLLMLLSTIYRFKVQCWKYYAFYCFQIMCTSFLKSWRSMSYGCILLFFFIFFSYKIIFITKLENIIFPSWKLQYFLQRWWKKKYEYRKVIFWTSNVIHRHCYGCSFASFNLISVISF